jgi:AraC-like DNA-binding protein
MIKKGQGPMVRRPVARSLMDVAFFNRRHPALGVELMALSDLLHRASAEHFVQPQRPRFHLLIMVTSGVGTHFLDFEQVACRPGTVLHVRPGQVQQFGRDAALEADVLLFTPEFILPEVAPQELPWFGSLIDNAVSEGVLQLRPRDRHYLHQGFKAIEVESRRSDGSALSARILQHLVHALLIQAMRCASPAEVIPSQTHYWRLARRFMKLVDARFAECHQVEGYARELACSTKTLRRCCVAMRGVLPKQLIEERILLEAKRLLAHTAHPIEQIAGSIGFSEHTNFVKFFRRHAGLLPSRFRDSFPGASRTRKTRAAGRSAETSTS